VRTSRAAKRAHAATVDKAEDTFAATGIYRYNSDIVSDEDFEPSEITRKHEMPDENLEGTEEGHSDVNCPFRVDGPDLPTHATARKYCSHWHRSNKPIAKSFCGGQRTQEKSSGVRILPGTPYRMFIESKKKKKEKKKQVK
jgi:hypothetical protein